MAESYEKAGVNLEAGYEVVRRIKKHVASTARTGVMGTIGAFGGMFDLAALGVKEPVLVSGTDGVGTKLKLAFALDKHDTIGIDAVAMCVNDVLAQGAEPLFSSIMWPWGTTNRSRSEGIVCGVAEGCRPGGLCARRRRDGRDAGHVRRQQYDIAGFTVGVVERSRLHRRVEGQDRRRAGRDRLVGRPFQRLLAGAQGAVGQRTGTEQGLSRTE